MNEEALDFLTRLVAAPSPSGYEQPAQRVFRDYVGRFAAGILSRSFFS